MIVSLARRHLDGVVVTTPSRRCSEDGARQGSRAGAKFDNGEIVGLVEAQKFGIDPTGQHGAEQRPDLG